MAMFRKNLPLPSGVSASAARDLNVLAFDCAVCKTASASAGTAGFFEVYLAT